MGIVVLNWTMGIGELNTSEMHWVARVHFELTFYTTQSLSSMIHFVFVFYPVTAIEFRVQ